MIRAKEFSAATSQPMRYKSHFLLPILAVVTICFAALAGLLLWLTQAQDRMALERETELVRTALSARLEAMRVLVKDYGRWDEAVNRLVVRFDPEWADQNMGPHLFKLHGYEHSFVIDEHGRTIYSSTGNRRSAQSAHTSLGGGFSRAAARLARPEAPADLHIAGLTRVNGSVAVFGVGIIQPSAGRTVAVPARRLLVVVEYIDADFLARIEKHYRLNALELTDSPLPGAAALPLSYYDGKHAASLSWTGDAPGTRSRARATPWLAAVMTILTLLSTLALRHARTAERALLASEAKARHLANHDTLTGLPNRRAFVEQLRTRQPTAGPVALLYLDLDGFKEVNDVFGHEAGDALLKGAVERLHAVVAWRGMLARIGGDEFAIVVTGASALDNAEVISTAIVHSFEEPFETAGYRLVVGTSVGVVWDDGGLSGDELVRRADIAMYVAKAEGKRRVRFYRPGMEQGREVNKQLECELREAIQRGEISVHFQPIVEAQSGRIVSVEALARWRSSTRGNISPDIFIPVAESSGLITELGKQVLRKACEQTVTWDVDLAVNLSPAQFWDEALFEDITAILVETGFPAGRLELEITEGYLLRRPDAAAEILAKLQRLGIRVALDDFGTGYASVAYLQRFKLDKLKLDRSFVDRVAFDIEAASVAVAIVGLGHALNLSITAEGVETIAQADMLRAAGCTHLQGWLYGKPVPSHELELMEPQSGVSRS